MGITSTAVIYATIGLCIAAALALRDEHSSAARRAGTFALGALFWPLYAPGLLAARPPPLAAAPPTHIHAAEARLLAALSRVEGIAEEVLAPEVARVRAITGQLSSMERRVAEMDELLGSPEFAPAAAEAALRDLAGRGVSDEDPRVQSVRARLRNIERLRALRDRTAGDLERVSFKLEEMSSQLQLLKFAGRPDAEVVRLVKEIAESVGEATEGILAAG
ncbi:MAG: hypothetical protein ACYC8T_28255 [Myxococcaceae bacterium]